MPSCVAGDAGKGAVTATDSRVTPRVRAPRAADPSRQDTLAARYPFWVRALVMAAFTLAFFGWLNEAWLFLWESPIWLNRYTEYAIILAFGLWRIHAEQNRYTRKRLIILVGVVTVLWWLIPWLSPFFEPYVGFLWAQPVFPALHTPGTLTFFLVLALVFLFGRRVICGFGCPCVGIRETVGFAFRDRTLRGKWVWRLRHVKWLFFVWYAGVLVATQFPPNAWTVSFVGGFGLVVGLTYFGSFFLVPLTGNRFYCRYLCPYGATFGLLNHAGFYGVEMDADRCVDCRRCEQACDMGIPVWEQGKATGRVTGLEDCMGCARCIVSCPTDALALRDVRSVLWPTVRRDATRLLGASPVRAAPRVAPPERPAGERAGDWAETHAPLDPAALAEQAARCLDCGVPGCRNACPLANRIPDWLAAAAAGNWRDAADIAQSTNPLPEACGRLCPQDRLCEGGCARGGMEGAVTIGAVEGAILERALADGWSPPGPPARRVDRSAAVIGAGPAGLACAERLNAAGWTVTVHDRHHEIGGLLATGLPAFRIGKAFLARRREWLAAAGVRFVLGVVVDEAQIRGLAAAHDVLFLGTGAQRPRAIDLPGREKPGVLEALGFLAAVNAGEAPPLDGRRVLVLGGGDTAMDCARSALRLGATVTVAYRGPESRLRAAPAELAETRAEGAGFAFEHSPVAIVGADGVEAVRFATPSGEQPLACDCVILALGQQPDPPPWLATLGVATDDTGRIRVDAEGRTSSPRVYAGGDASHGPDLVVTALAAGRRAAAAILADRAQWVWRRQLPREATPLAAEETLA
jgi:glutamate synthase (NADPH/NADH) small chain